MIYKQNKDASMLEVAYIVIVVACLYGLYCCYEAKEWARQVIEKAKIRRYFQKDPRELSEWMDHLERMEAYSLKKKD